MYSLSVCKFSILEEIQLEIKITYLLNAEFTSLLLFSLNWMCKITVINIFMTKIADFKLAPSWGRHSKKQETYLILHSTFYLKAPSISNLHFLEIPINILKINMSIYSCPPFALLLHLISTYFLLWRPRYPKNVLTALVATFAKVENHWLAFSIQVSGSSLISVKRSSMTNNYLALFRNIRWMTAAIESKYIYTYTLKFWSTC